MIPGEGFHAWAPGLEAPLRQPWEVPRQGVCFSRVLNLDFCLTLRPVVGLGVSGYGVIWATPAVHCLSVLICVCLQMSLYHKT